MTELFKLSAEVFLSRRLKNLLRIDDNVEIDTSYITCAEYQLFIDEKLKVGEHRQPDHWTDYRFPLGDSKKPITGVRASDAKEFCEWLTQRDSALGFTYRLPTLAEVHKYQASEKQVGCWCKDGEKNVIAGIEPEQWQVWKNNFAFALQDVPDPDLAIVYARSLANHLYDALSLDFSLTPPSYHLGFSLTAILQVRRHTARTSEFRLEFNNAINLANCLNLDSSDETTRTHVINDFIRNFQRTFIFALFRRDFSLALFFNTVDIRSYLLLIYALWDALSDVYRELNAQQWQELSREYAVKKKDTLRLYSFFVLLDERRSGEMPAWEGIRIVREKITT